MAHIANCLFDSSSGLGLNNYIARELSPQRLQSEKPSTAPTPITEKEKLAWRMRQPAESHKHQFSSPSKEKTFLATGRSTPGSDSSLSPGQSCRSFDKERSKPGTALRLKGKDQTLMRRCKISITEIGAMTTVQETLVDSPTVPGRPPLHGRSSSAPDNSCRQRFWGESILDGVSRPHFNDSVELVMQSARTVLQEIESRSATPKKPGLPLLKRPLSPKSLTPLIIPTVSAPLPRLLERESSGIVTPGPVVPPKSARMLEFSSPIKTSASKQSFGPIPISSVSSTSLPSVKQQLKQPITTTSDPQPWSAEIDSVSCSQNRSQTPGIAHVFGYRCGTSEGDTSIMDQGRPRKRFDACSCKQMYLALNTELEDEDLKAFEVLPQSFIPANAGSSIPADEIERLRKQAMGQAVRFGVLSSKDVDKLSRELRSLDERCEYLRNTLRNLSSGRRDLQGRICIYLRSSRVAQFSRESLLGQEEALSELNVSIEGWVAKRERAENRRTRVRQKLLEHIAAALILELKAKETQVAHVVKDMQIQSQYTPPHSPTKSTSHTPLAAPLEASIPEPMTRADVESIRIYAGSDMFSLFADVEDEISRMSRGEGEMRAREKSPSLEVEEAIQSGITLKPVAFEGFVGAPIKESF